MGLSLKVGPMGALLVVASAAACAAPELVQGDAGSNIWPIYKNRTLAVARKELNRTVGLRRITGDLRFSFFKSPRGMRYLEWQTLVDGASHLPPHFYLPFKAPDCQIKVNESVFVFRGFVPEKFQYGHLMADQLPMLLHAYRLLPDRLAVLMDPEQKVKSFMEWLDPKLAERLLYMPAGAVCCTPELALLEPGDQVSRPEALRISALSMSMHHFALQARPPAKGPSAVVLYERLPQLTHGRLLDEEQMSELTRLAKKRLQMHNRSDELISFNGSGSFAEQHRIFSSASLVIGPHGAGFANVLWMSDCRSAIELMCAVDALDVRGCFVAHGPRHKPRPMTFWRLFGGAPWLRYFIVWMRPRDQHLSDYLKVDIKGFDLAMEKALAEDPVI